MDEIEGRACGHITLAQDGDYMTVRLADGQILMISGDGSMELNGTPVGLTNVNED